MPYAAHNPHPLATSFIGAQARGTLLIVALIGLALLLAGAVALTKNASLERDRATSWEVHTLDVLDATAQLRTAALYAVRGERGYLITGDAKFLAPYYESLADISSGEARLEKLVQDNAEQIEQLARIEGRLDHFIGIMTHMISLHDSGRRDELMARITAGDGRQALDRVLLELGSFEAVERTLLEQRRRERERTVRDAERYETLLWLAGAILLALGTWASFALRQSLKREEAIRRELELRAATDELTGLANRRETLTALDRQIATTRRHGRPLSLAILDIDHFKRVNDTYGHPVGDEVIRHVARVAVEVMREEDLVGRLGGEEFVVILPDTGAEAAMIACDRLRRRIAEQPICIDTGERLQITLSAGVAQMTMGDDRIRLVTRADTALYDAKSGGRDMVLLAA